MNSILLKLLASAALAISFSSCSNDPKPKEYSAAYDFLKSSFSIEKQPSLRMQRDIAFEKAKYTLKTQLKEEITAFLSLYLENIGLKNQKQIEMLCEYVYMDMDTIFKEITQENIEILSDGAMKLTVSLDKELFINELKKSIQANFKRERAVWERFQEQRSQDLIKSSLENFLLLER